MAFVGSVWRLIRSIPVVVVSRYTTIGIDRALLLTPLLLILGPGDDDTIDCTELPGISAVQCVAKQCIVAQCRPGFELVNNRCVKDGTSSIERLPQMVITEKIYKKRDKIIAPSRIRARSTEEIYKKRDRTLVPFRI